MCVCVCFCLRLSVESASVSACLFLFLLHADRHFTGEEAKQAGGEDSTREMRHEKLRRPIQADNGPDTARPANANATNTTTKNN